MKVNNAPTSKSTDFFREINVRADSCDRNADGSFRLRIPVRPMGREEIELLKELFPNTFERMEELLDIETLLQSIVK